MGWTNRKHSASSHSCRWHGGIKSNWQWTQPTFRICRNLAHFSNDQMTETQIWLLLISAVNKHLYFAGGASPAQLLQSSSNRYEESSIILKLWDLHRRQEKIVWPVKLWNFQSTQPSHTTKICPLELGILPWGAKEGCFYFTFDSNRHRGEWSNKKKKNLRNLAKLEEFQESLHTSKIQNNFEKIMVE